jgi:hypothetical protein
MSEEDQYTNITNRYNINSLAPRLKYLEKYKLAIIVDDSISMAAPGPCQVPGKPTRTIWDELMETLGGIIDITSVIDKSKDGPDVHFLNRGTIRNVHYDGEHYWFFSPPPTGGSTPISKVLQAVLAENNQMIKERKQIAKERKRIDKVKEEIAKEKKQIVKKNEQIIERKLHILVMTCGYPTNAIGDIDIASLEDVLKNEKDGAFITFLSLANDKSSMGYLNELNKTISNLNVVNDYPVEFEIRKRLHKSSSEFKFSRGDHIIETILRVNSYGNSIDNKLESSKSCCVIC